MAVADIVHGASGAACEGYTAQSYRTAGADDFHVRNPYRCKFRIGVHRQCAWQIGDVVVRCHIGASIHDGH